MNKVLGSAALFDPAKAHAMPSHCRWNRSSTARAANCGTENGSVVSPGRSWSSSAPLRDEGDHTVRVPVRRPLVEPVVAAGRGHLREQDVTVPTIDPLTDETAEVVATATGSPAETAAALMHAWRARNLATASSELRALAERTDDPEHRRLALAYA
ncbi:hypothetical protein [Micromonospora sp. IBHARD004]|uniref:hypothetical protein n=1 Tax=Micromonospora sp. IBHARD004 TaxID=3457764 RepID=UPI0040586058